MDEDTFQGLNEINDQLSDEDRSILAFLERYFERQGTKAALAMLRNDGTKLDDLCVVMDGCRYLYLRRARLRLIPLWRSRRA